MGSGNRRAIKLLLDKTVYFPLLNWVAKINFAGSGRGGGGVRWHDDRVDRWTVFELGWTNLFGA